MNQIHKIPSDPDENTDTTKQSLKKPLSWQDQLQIGALAILDASNLGYLTGVGNETIRAYSGMCDLPIISIVSSDICANNFLAFTQALLILLLPMAIFGLGIKYGLTTNPKSLWMDKEKRPWLIAGLLLLFSVGYLEFSNLTIAAENTLLIAPCDPATNLMCDFAEIERQREEAQMIIQEATRHGVIFTCLNFCLAFGTAVAAHNVSRKTR